MRKQNEIYLEISSINDNEKCLAPIETVVTLFTLRYCESEMNVRFVRRNIAKDVRCHTVDVSDVEYRLVSEEEVPFNASSCELPNVIINDDAVVAGLCASLRQVVKNTISQYPEHSCRCLLGFKDSCLLAPSETSVWTKYCEVDLLSTLKNLSEDLLSNIELPVSMARFEAHMSEPVRLHNVYKYTMSKKFAPNGVVSQEKGVVPEHLYAEGSFVTLADIIIFVCFHILFNFITSSEIRQLLPLTCRWYDRLMEDASMAKCLNCIILEPSEISNIRYVLPDVEKQSLYKSDPKRYKPRNRIYTRQEDVENSLRLIDELKINRGLNIEPYGVEVELDWSKIPHEATPEGGALPIARLKRKFEQLENLCKPVLKLARKKDVIVDFCSGSGHLGILVAHLLPQCTVILLENKEESLNRSKERVIKLQLANVQFYQCNLDYFKGYFDIGMSLHACGVATDLVIQHCIRKNAIFVSCPCCYGSVHDCHHITYPRSDIFRRNINKRDYLILGHSADQTHDVKNAKTAQGNECMAIIDTDRKLQAEQFGYEVYLAKLVPETCTPKNHLLVGIPKYRNP
ncbi:glutathione S-transferase C-terminal domain-containing protein homolog [Venturia canescens]|uniref:glutathione S-transferase C-terminal domain-containing protein homolog n=1 Tax=Venturia canescens TaxID=32260 RepID=UPI001C9D1061|nr:glutathione S-transferase C-terminal domain-containing protein homolog [Venturia canescens]